MKELLFLIDANHMCSRAYYTHDLYASSGFPTGVIYGFFSMLRAECAKWQPDGLIVVWDYGKSEKRKKLWADYKSKREMRNDSWFKQINKIHNILTALGIPCFGITGVEADDIIGLLTLEKSVAEEFKKIIIISSDTDMQQLIQEKVVQYNPISKIAIDEKVLLDTTGLRPDQIVDYKALLGDKDEVPGIPGVGKKTATELLKKFDNYKNFMMCHYKETPKKMYGKILANKSLVALGQELARIITSPEELSPEQRFDYDMWLSKVWDERKDMYVDEAMLTGLLHGLEFKWSKELEKFLSGFMSVIRVK